MLKQGYVEGVVERPSKFNWPNGKPKPSMWGLKVDNIIYGTKANKPSCSVGDYVQFEATENGQYWDADAATIKPATAPASAAVPTASTGGATSTTSSKGSTGGWNDPARQDSIIYQSSLERAIKMTGLLLQNGLVDFGKAKGAQKIELVEILVDDYTVRFFEDVKRLAPPEHGDPTEATYSEEASALQKPVRKTKAQPAPAPEAEEEGEDDLPFR